MIPCSLAGRVDQSITRYIRMLQQVDYHLHQWEHLKNVGFRVYEVEIKTRGVVVGSVNDSK